MYYGSIYVGHEIRKHLKEVKKSNEKEKLCLYKLVIFGPSRVGKSSLFKILRNKACKKDSKSTGIYKVKMFKVSVTKTSTDSKFSWHKIKLEDEISRLRFELEEQIRDSKQKITLNLPQVDTEKPSEQLEVEKRICESINQPVEEVIKTSTLMVCYDSGGQAEFFDVMPLLATNPTGYIMVLDMSKDLDSSIISKANIEGKDYSLDEIPCSVLMKNAIASIHSCSSYTACKNLLVVGTHLDECKKNREKMITSLDDEIYECLVTDGGQNLFRERNQKNKMINTTYIHPVSNLCKSKKLKKITKQSVEEIHTAIEDMSKKNRWYDEISIKSHLFLLEIQLKLKNPPHYLTLSNYRKYAEECGINSKDEVDKLLKYFHKLGFIFYFKESNNKIIADIIFSPQWVFDRLSDIIFEKYSQKCLPQRKNIKKGVVKNDAQFFNAISPAETEESIDYLFEIFKSQNIMVEFPDKKHHYFMPALLSPGLPDDKSLQDILEKKFERRIHERLYVKFDNHYFPRVVFCYLANKLISIKKWKIDNDLRYNNILVFQIPHGYQHVGLFSYNTELVVEVYGEKDKDFYEKDHVKPHEISALLFQFINECCAMIEFQDNFKFGFICNKNNCKLFAGVKLQYPYLAEKYCEKCYFTDLSYDELIWLISPEVAGVMVCMYIL